MGGPYDAYNDKRIVYPKVIQQPQTSDGKPPTAGPWWEPQTPWYEPNNPYVPVVPAPNMPGYPHQPTFVPNTDKFDFEDFFNKTQKSKKFQKSCRWSVRYDETVVVYKLDLPGVDGNDLSVKIEGGSVLSANYVRFDNPGSEEFDDIDISNDNLDISTVRARFKHCVLEVAFDKAQEEVIVNVET